ncbi:unnamed protein product [Lactuca virosa]|uniref:Prolyl-tRNA synthetase n=1 Tax=Lactuca virosa TaxID=75947 RepID=A0AAU9MFG5_9ASTR|nr:unnamed protein product [Lactuca virosa]
MRCFFPTFCRFSMKSLKPYLLQALNSAIAFGHPLYRFYATTRSREFLWQEGHTAFASKEEADTEGLLNRAKYQKNVESYHNRSGAMKPNLVPNCIRSENYMITFEVEEEKFPFFWEKVPDENCK